MWLRDCAIKIRMSDNTPVITIHNESQINDIIEKLKKSRTFQSQFQNQSGETRKRTNAARSPEEDKNLTTYDKNGQTLQHQRYKQRKNENSRGDHHIYQPRTHTIVTKKKGTFPTTPQLTSK